MISNSWNKEKCERRWVDWVPILKTDWKEAGMANSSLFSINNTIQWLLYGAFRDRIVWPEWEDPLSGLANVGLWSSGHESYTWVLARTEPHIGVLCCIMPTLLIDKSRRQNWFEAHYLFSLTITVQSPDLSGYETDKQSGKKDEVMSWVVELEGYVRLYCLYSTCLFPILTIWCDLVFSC